MTKLLPLISLSLVCLAAPALRAQTLSADQQSLTFSSPVGGPPTSLPVNVTSNPTGAVILTTPVEQTDPSQTWLSASSSSGTTPTTVAVTVNPGALAIGTYTGSVVISVFNGSSVTVAVTLTVSSINVSPTSLAFVTAQGQTPLVQSVTLSSGQPLTFSVTANTTTGGNWLDVSPTTGLISGYTAVSAIPDPTLVPTLAPGVYSGNITITPTSGTSLTPVVIPVSLTVTPPPAVTVSPASVNLQYQTGGTNNNASETVTVATSGNQQVPFTATATNQVTTVGGTWVTVSPANGEITSAGTGLTIAYNTVASLPSGFYSGTVAVNTPSGSPTTTTIPVTLTVSSLPLLTVPTFTLNFTAELNSTLPPAQTVNITSTSATPQTYNVTATTTDGNPWLIVPASGTAPGPLSIGVNPSGLVPGSYSGTVLVIGQGTGNGQQAIPVTMTVSNDSALVTNFPSLALAYEVGQAATVSQIITLTSNNGAPLTFVATSATSTSTTCGKGWLALGGISGGTTGLLTVALNPQGVAPGTCTGTISIVASNAITGAAAVNSPLTIPVTATFSASSVLNVVPLNPAVLTVQTGGATQGPLVYALISSDSNELNFTVTTSTVNGGSGWLDASLTNDAGFHTVGISAVPGQLPPGTYTGAVTIAATTATGAAVANSPLTIPVTFLVTTGSLVLSPGALTFNQAVGGPAPSDQTVSITSSGTVLGFAATVYSSRTSNWLTASNTGTTPGSISVAVNGSGLTQGTYHGAVTVVSTTSNSGNSPMLVPVTLVMNAGTISASAASLTFVQVVGGPPPPSQSLTLTGTPGTISFQASASSGANPWLTVTPTSGGTPATLQIAILQNSLQPGPYAGSITITAPGALGSPMTIPVALNMQPSFPLSASPNVVTFTAAAGSTSTQTAQINLTSNGGATSFNVAMAGGGSWLSVAPSSGTTPGNVAVFANPTGLATGVYSGTLTFSSPNAVATVSVTVNLVVGNVPPPTVTAVANAASYSAGALAPGENVVIFGSGIGPPQVAPGTVTNGVVNTVAGATRVLFNGVPAPIVYALTDLTSVMVPYEISGIATVSVVVEYQGVQSAPLAYSAALAAPGIYAQNEQGVGPGAILNQDYSLNQAGNPAPKGSVVAVYMTGEGFTVGAQDGAIATGLLSPVLSVSATVGGIPATVYYAGTSPGIVTGAMQVNVLIPPTAASGGAVPIVITVGTGTQAVTTQAGMTVAVE